MKWIKSVIFFFILSTLAGQLVDGTKYKPYVSLVVGFMLISFLIQPVLSLTGSKEIIQSAWSTMVKEENTLSFHEDAKEIRKEQIEAQITRILKQEDIKIQKAVVRLLDDGTIQSIEIITENKEKQEKKIKTILLRFYNLKDSNINVSE